MEVKSLRCFLCNCGVKISVKESDYGGLAMITIQCEKKLHSMGMRRFAGTISHESLMEVTDKWRRDFSVERELKDLEVIARNQPF